MSRDWQKDMELCERAMKTESGLTEFTEPYNGPEMTIYWLQQYAAEKERADKAEAREQKLREALEEAHYHLMREEHLTAEDIVNEALSSLYPKEETKPAVLEEEEA